MMSETCDIAAVFKRHFKRVYRLCYSYLGSAADAEDAAQATFMRLIDHPRSFESEEHEKAWLIVCASNLCKDILKSAARTRVQAMPEDVDAQGGPFASVDAVDETIELVLGLPEKYKDVVYLHYYEGYKTDEIAQMLELPPSTVRNRLRDARAILKEKLGGEDG